MPYEPDTGFEIDVDQIIQDIKELGMNYFITERQVKVLREAIKQLESAK